MTLILPHDPDFFSNSIKIKGLVLFTAKRLVGIKFKGLFKMNSVVGDLLKYTNPSHAKGHVMHTIAIEFIILRTQWVCVLG